MYTTKAEREEKLRNKRTRLDADAVESMILRAFKKHQYISQKHLVAITGQPEVGNFILQSQFVPCFQYLQSDIFPCALSRNNVS